MVTSPVAETLEVIHFLFWGAHLPTSVGQKFRYFMRTLPEFGSVPTTLQKAVASMWYDHCYEAETMQTVVVELRKALLHAQVNFPSGSTESYEQVNTACVDLFSTAYEEVKGRSPRAALVQKRHNYDRPVSELSN